MKKCCKESCKVFPFTSEHLWRADLHGMPYGKCQKCGKDFEKYEEKLYKRTCKLIKYVLPSVCFENKSPKTVELIKQEKLTAVKKWLIVNHRKYKNGQAWKKAFLKMLEGIIE